MTCQQFLVKSPTVNRKSTGSSGLRMASSVPLYLGPRSDADSCSSLCRLRPIRNPRPEAIFWPGFFFLIMQKFLNQSSPATRGHLTFNEEGHVPSCKVTVLYARPALKRTPTERASNNSKQITIIDYIIVQTVCTRFRIYGANTGLNFFSFIMFAFPLILILLPLAWLSLMVILIGPK